MGFESINNIMNKMTDKRNEQITDALKQMLKLYGFSTDYSDYTKAEKLRHDMELKGYELIIRWHETTSEHVLYHLGTWSTQ